MATPKKLRVTKNGLARLRDADPDFGAVLDAVGPCRLTYRNASCDLESLVRAIVYQQLSGKAAGTIFGRFRELFPGDGFPSAQEIGRMHHARLRKAGVSRQKQAAIKDLCRHVGSGALPLEDLAALDDEDLIERLTAVRGIGRWSAQMFMLFHLGRRDVWPVDDLGIRKGVQKLRRLDALPSPRAMEAYGEPYAGQRSIVSWYLWRWQDGPAAG
ncbi:MAG: DNA-3-methyladenine glycosylase 2 family protein [Myxococcota bacterium]